MFKPQSILTLAILPVLFGPQPCTAKDHVFAKRPQPWQRRDKPILSALTSKQGWSRVTLYSPHVIRVGGKSWSKPSMIPSLRRTKQPDGYEVAPDDLWPTWHAKTGTVLVTGKTFNFAEGTRENRLRERVSYVVFNIEKGVWEPLRFLVTPKIDHSGHLITGANAGCTQRIDLPGGEILLPVRYWRDAKRHNYTSVVMRCSYDGKTLIYKEHGSELNIPQGRGLYEPSLTQFQSEYFLTMRADHSAYVTRGKDGIHFQPIREWTFDDGKPLGSYNTQQHWVTIGGGLFLVYTCRGANNDHIMRHRAPLFIGQVNSRTLQVMRATERVLLAENHATLGNSGICRISDNESWVTCGEGLLRLGKRKGQNNKVLVVKITAARKDDDGFVRIFDGTTLNGWYALPADSAKAWDVKDGAIVGDGDKGRGYLVYQNKELSDLEIKLSYRFPGKGNSGIDVRARKDKTGRRQLQSYHADLGHVGIGKQVLGAWDLHTPGRREHACFRGTRLVIDKNDKPHVTQIKGAVTAKDIKQSAWNDVHIIAKGNNFKFFINGKPASEFTENIPQEKRLDKGMITLQLHDPGMVVQFKDIRIKLLP